MNKKTLIGSIAALAAAGLVAAPAAAAKPSTPAKPLPGTAVITSTLTGAVGSDVTGSISLEVDQMGVNTPIVMANIELPAGLTITAGDVTVTSNEDTGSCGTPVVSVGTRTFTVKGISCTDADADNVVEFTLSVDNVVATNTLLEGSYEAESQYRTNPNRKVKEQSWTVEQADAVTVTAGLIG